MTEENRKLKEELNKLQAKSTKVQHNFGSLANEMKGYKNKNASNNISRSSKPTKIPQEANEYLNLLKEINNKEDSVSSSQCISMIETLLESKQKQKFINKHESRSSDSNSKMRRKSQSRQRIRGGSLSNAIKTDRALCSSTNKLNIELQSTHKKVKGILKRQYTQLIDNELLSSMRSKGRENRKDGLKTISRTLTKREKPL